MATKTVNVDGLGSITLHKRRGVRSIKLSLNHNGDIRVTLPTWLPYRLGLDFVKLQNDWIKSHAKPQHIFKPMHRIGKAHNLFFYHQQRLTKPKVRIAGNEIRVAIPIDMPIEHPAVQTEARCASIRALKLEANRLLPGRVEVIASRYGYSYRKVTIKQLKARWGSCNHEQVIVLNCFLMQLPWEYIDYVILHELVHTRIMAHGNPFWSEMKKHLPNVSHIRKQMRDFQPTF